MAYDSGRSTRRICRSLGEGMGYLVQVWGYKTFRFGCIGRVCYRNKNAAYPWLPVKHKARIVCRGDRDPDITVLRRDAQTMTRLSLMVLLQVAAAKSKWFLFNTDITGAFLQGDQKLASRREALYLRQPREGLPGLRGQLLLGSRHFRVGKFTPAILATSTWLLDSAWFCSKHFGQSSLLLLQVGEAHLSSWSPCGWPDWNRWNQVKRNMCWTSSRRPSTLGLGLILALMRCLSMVVSRLGSTKMAASHWLRRSLFVQLLCLLSLSGGWMSEEPEDVMVISCIL